MPCSIDKLLPRVWEKDCSTEGKATGTGHTYERWGPLGHAEDEDTQSHRCRGETGAGGKPGFGLEGR